ncbi:MAG: hypothetical protein CFH01_00048 [Alphaproteobacteria bacterium MarineAlpha2_Bin1]|nr:MAG: hypothetical protein CFH01_00048 [Alphaproteobacteria bacterium MarineAlpha2_Bin1]|tara:strand:+ start:314 stop:1180 length:867 start_codon:yes stop_codon:yes gene_type:complete
MKPEYIGKTKVNKIEEYVDRLDPSFVFKKFNNYIIEENQSWLLPDFVEKKTLLLYFSFHSYLIETPRYKILIDTCVGNHKSRPLPNWNMRNSNFLQKFKQFNLDRSMIDFVMCTHLHADHVGWNTLLDNGKWVPTFPNAEYIFSKKDYDFFNNVKEGDQGYLSMIDSVRPIVEHSQAKLVDDSFSIDETIHLEPTPGHTPGHICIKLNSENEHAIFTGDLIHHPIQVCQPDLETNFCFDPKLAVKTRKEFIENNTDQNVIIFPAHFSNHTKGLIKSSKMGSVYKVIKS